MSELVHIPDEFTVWAFSDTHGVKSGLVASLRQAGLIDAKGRWSAPAGTALVGCGDYIDRGRDSAGVLDLLFRLREEATAADSLVVLARGNHEEMLADTLNGLREPFKVWVSHFAGGLTTLASLGITENDPDLHRGAPELAAALRQLHPQLATRLALMPDAVIWRDVLFTHAGPVPGFGPADLGPKTTAHLWDTPTLWQTHREECNLASRHYSAYHEAGIGRYVFGHTSHEEPALYQGGKALCLDTNTSYGAFGVRTGLATLARIPASGSLGAADFVFIDTRSAPDRGVRADD